MCLAFGCRIFPPPPTIDNCVSPCVAPPSDHHCCTITASGEVGLKTRVPPSSRDPLRPPFHSFTTTPFKAIKGLPSNMLSSCFALSPHSVTSILTPESSASVMSRFTSSLPSLDVKGIIERNPATMPHKSTLQGTVFE